jgi:serpin B
MNNTKKVIVALSILCAVLFVVSGVLGYMLMKEREEPSSPGGSSGNNEPINIVTKTGDFEIDLFKESYQSSLNEDVANTVISPLSVKMAMAMVTEGARENTLTELREVLQLDENSKTYYQSLLDDISEQEDITLDIANSVWSRQGLSFETEFLDLVEQYYYAQAESLNFGDPKSVDIINDWVSDNTNGKIDSVLEEIDPLNIMFLINAIYFNADWTEQFDEDSTREKDFTLANGTTIKTDLMSMDSDFQYQENDEFQAVELPYGDDRRYVMRVYLPKEGKDINEFVNGMTREKMSEWGEAFTSMEGYLELPKFKTEYSKNLNDILKELGIREAFDDILANFKGIINLPNDNAYISKVIHKTYIDVSERGTEAAAVTSVEMSFKGMPMEPEERFEMIVDRPFFFTIDDTQSNEILFMGTILNPTE